MRPEISVFVLCPMLCPASTAPVNAGAGPSAAAPERVVKSVEAVRWGRFSGDWSWVSPGKYFWNNRHFSHISGISLLVTLERKKDEFIMFIEISAKIWNYKQEWKEAFKHSYVTMHFTIFYSIIWCYSLTKFRLL